MSFGGINNKVVQDGDKELQIIEPCKRRKPQPVTSGMDSDDDRISTITAGIMTPSKVRSKNRKESLEEEHAQEDTVTTDVEEQRQQDGSSSASVNKTGCSPTIVKMTRRSGAMVKKESTASMNGAQPKGAEVFSSVQQRETSTTEVLLNEALLTLNTVRTMEGLKSLKEANVNNVIKRMSKKMDGKVVHILTYTQGVCEDDVDDDLALKGNQVLNKLNDAYQKMVTLVKFLHFFFLEDADRSQRRPRAIELRHGRVQRDWHRAPVVCQSSALPAAVLRAPERGHRYSREVSLGHDSRRAI